jgi:hypothetical protein
LKNNNTFMLGITAHNMGVVCVLAGRDHHALPLFEEAISAKRKSFGSEHPEVAVSFSTFCVHQLGSVLICNRRFV